jgi:hypothetical protein
MVNVAAGRGGAFTVNAMEKASFESKEIVKRLGGEALLEQLRVQVIDEDSRRVSLCFNRRNPQGVRSAVITRQPGGVYNVNCFGHLSLNNFNAPPRGCALRVLPENLAAELGRLTGIGNLPSQSF